MNKQLIELQTILNDLRHQTLTDPLCFDFEYFLETAKRGKSLQQDILRKEATQERNKSYEQE